MHSVHVDDYPGGALVVARVHQAGRHFRESLFTRSDDTMIAG